MAAREREYRRETTRYKLEKVIIRRKLARIKAESSMWERKKSMSLRRRGKRGK